MKENISPEERLLRLIRKGKKQDKPLEDKSAAAVLNPLSPVFKRPAIKLNLQKVALIVFIVSWVYPLSSFVYSYFGLKKIKLPDIAALNAVTEPISKPALEAKTREFYAQGVRERKIFSSAGQPAVSSGSQVSGIDPDLIKDFTVVGIIAGDSPQAIIEDKKAQKTYYLEKGQFMGEFRIEEIQDGKIVLDYKGQRFELHI